MSYEKYLNEKIMKKLLPAVVYNPFRMAKFKKLPLSTSPYNSKTICFKSIININVIALVKFMCCILQTLSKYQHLIT